MSHDIFDRRRAERFAQLLDEANGRPRRHSRGAADDQLAELVTMGHTLTRIGPSVRTGAVDPDFRSSLRAMLVATAEREGIGVTAQPDPGAEEPASRWRAALGAGAGRRIRARGAIVVGVAMGAVAVSGMSFASEDAVPGDALYGVKISAEKAQLALAGSDISRGQLFLGFARNRLVEASTVQDGGSRLGGVLTDMDSDSREGVRLLNSAAVQQRDEAPLDAVDTFVSAQRKGLAPLLDRLTGADRQRAVQSLTLLEDVDKRVRALRTALGCDAAAAGTDTLGPRPEGCAAKDADEPDRDRSGPATSGGTSKGRAADQNEEVAPSPRPASSAGTSRGGQSSVAPAAPTTAPADAPRQPPAPQQKGEDDNVLERIFGGILG